MEHAVDHYLFQCDVFGVLDDQGGGCPVEGQIADGHVFHGHPGEARDVDSADLRDTAFHVFDDESPEPGGIVVAAFRFVVRFEFYQGRPYRIRPHVADVDVFRYSRRGRDST